MSPVGRVPTIAVHNVKVRYLEVMPINLEADVQIQKLIG